MRLRVQRGVQLCFVCSLQCIAWEESAVSCDHASDGAIKLSVRIKKQYHTDKLYFIEGDRAVPKLEGRSVSFSVLW